MEVNNAYYKVTVFGRLKITRLVFKSNGGIFGDHDGCKLRNCARPAILYLIRYNKISTDFYCVAYRYIMSDLIPKIEYITSDEISIRIIFGNKIIEEVQEGQRHGNEDTQDDIDKIS